MKDDASKAFHYRGSRRPGPARGNGPGLRTTLGPVSLLKAASTVYVSVGHRSSLVRYHDHVLELTGDRQWRIITAAEYAQSNQIEQIDRSSDG